jgi:hypothetical protein
LVAEDVAKVSIRGAELYRVENGTDRAGDGEPGDGGRWLVSSEPVEKRGKKPQGAGDSSLVNYVL